VVRNTLNELDDEIFIVNGRLVARNITLQYSDQVKSIVGGGTTKILLEKSLQSYNPAKVTIR
jgi:hypothetical protein